MSDHPKVRGLDEVLVRKIAEGVIYLADISKLFSSPEAFRTVINFSGANMKRVLNEDALDKDWSKTRPRDGYIMEELRANTTLIVWFALSLGKLVNKYRRQQSYPPINWVDEATTLDKKGKADAKDSIPEG
jgi:hypothetical protein